MNGGPGGQPNGPVAEARGRRLVLAAALLLWLTVSLPLALGWKTFYLRDVFFTHLHFKAFGARELAHGRIPAFNPAWGLGQPFRGNPNALAFYPGNALYLLLPFWSAFNLHYALHWLLALFAMRALARALGQGQTAALAAGLTYAGCGFMLSCLTFYNLLTVAAWWPVVLLGAVEGGRRGIALGGLACGLALLGGEPVTATLGLLPLAFVAVERHGLRRGLATAVAIGGLGLTVALPQLVATLRVLPFTYRGAHRFTTVGTRFVLHPIRYLELLLPLPFGNPVELGPGRFWASRLAHHAPFVLSLSFGVVGLALAIAAARRRPWWAVPPLIGLLGAWLLGHVGRGLLIGGAGLVRFPEKLLFWFALFAPLLVGWGLEDWTRRTDRRVRGVLAAAAGLALAAPAATLFVPYLVTALAPDLTGADRAGVVLVQTRTWAIAAATGAVLLALTAWAKARRQGVALLALVLVALLPLHSLVATDSTAPYRQPAPWARRLGPGTAVVFSTFGSPFGDTLTHYRLVRPTQATVARIGHLDLNFPTGVLAGLTYPIPPDLEGMMSPLLFLIEGNLRHLGWRERVSWLRALGVQAITLTEVPDADGLTRLDTVDRFGVTTYLDRVDRTAPAAWWPRSVVAAPGPAAAVVAVNHSADPVADVVAPTAVDQSPGGRVTLLAAGPDALDLEVESGGGVVALRRAYQPLLVARAEGHRLRTLPLDVALLGVEVPPGRHRVGIRASSWPEIAAGVTALATALALLALVLRRRPARSVTRTG